MFQGSSFSNFTLIHRKLRQEEEELIPRAGICGCRECIAGNASCLASQVTEAMPDHIFFLFESQSLPVASCQHHPHLNASLILQSRRKRKFHSKHLRSGHPFL